MYPYPPNTWRAPYVARCAASLAKTRGPKREQPCRVDIRSGPRQRAADRLELDDWLAELAALARVADGTLDRCARDTDRLRGDADTPAVEPGERDAETTTDL